MDHDPDGMGDLCRHAVVLEGRQEANDSLWCSGTDNSEVGVAGSRVIRQHINPASTASNLAAVDRSLECNTRHTKRLKIARSHDLVLLQVLKQSFDMGGTGHYRLIEKEFLFVCRKKKWQSIRNIVPSIGTARPHSRHALA